MERYEVVPIPVVNEDGSVSGYQAMYLDSDNNYHILENVDVTYDSEKERYTYKYKNESGEETTATSNATVLYVNRDAKDKENPKIYTNKEEKMVKNDEGKYQSEETASESADSSETGGDESSEGAESESSGESGKKYLTYDMSTVEHAIFYDGATDEQRNLYDYALSLTEAFYHSPDNELNNDANMQAYYKNIYNQMTTRGYTTYNRMIKEGYMNATETDERVVFADDQWLITQLKQGKLTISYYSAVDKEFIKTTLDDDESITEKEDKAKIKLAEQVYNTSMDRIEKEDKMFDLKLNKLESEHSALQTEYESVAKVISKNVEKSFSTFNA